MTVVRHVRLLLVGSALLIGGAVWVAALVERHGADAARSREQQGQQLLTGMLDEETGMRGFVLTRKNTFLEPYDRGRDEYGTALATLRRDDDAAERRLLDAADAIAREWQATATDTVAEVRRGDVRTAVRNAPARKAIFDRFRAAHAALLARLEARRHDDARTAGIISALGALIVALMVAAVGDFLVRRRDRADRRRRERESDDRTTQAEFADALLLSESEPEAHDLLRRHLERTIPETQIVVLKRNNSADRLEPATRVEDPGIAERLDGAQPRSCLAVRLGRPNDRGIGTEPLMGCEICGKVEGSSMCKPLLVGSEVIGSVLATSPRQLDEEDRRRMRDSVAQATPTLANLRNLALAEARAATDVLTGLPNRRAIEDTLKRMVAQASRTVQPLSALMLDLDHFKTINDLYGHEGGDSALASVGSLLTATLRESDFAGRQGGEEFVVLAPNTDAAGAARLAENLRAAIAEVRVPELDHGLSVSIGVATLPDVANDGTGLIRMADRGLYAAKERGRNRVEVIGASAAQRRGDTDATAAST